MSRRFKELDCIQAHVDVSRGILEDLDTLVEKNPNFSKEERVNLYEKRIKRILDKMSKYEMDTIGKDIAVDPTSMCSKVHEWVKKSYMSPVRGEKADLPVEEGDAKIKEEAEPEPSPKSESNPASILNVEGNSASIPKAAGNPAPIPNAVSNSTPSPQADNKPENKNDQPTATAPKTDSTNNNVGFAENAENAEAGGS